MKSVAGKLCLSETDLVDNWSNLNQLVKEGSFLLWLLTSFLVWSNKKICYQTCGFGHLNLSFPIMQ